MSIDAHSGTRILIVDDERLILLSMSATLKRAGYVPVAIGDIESAVKILKENSRAFSAIVTDIMMGDMDGFMFRDLVRGIDATIPMFFLTALDPEEGGGFLKRILEDPQSYYLPKAVKSGVITKRIQRIVASRRIERFIENKMEEDRKAFDLAAHIQRSMLPARALWTPCGFFTTLWRPMDMVSGDMFVAVPFGKGCYLYVLGDVQGHGISAALAMTAVQSFLVSMAHQEGAPTMSPSDIANLLQEFFRTNLAEVSYMTALICIHRPLLNEVWWISCGAPDLDVVDNGKCLAINPEKRGGMPIGLLPDTKYTSADEVRTELSKTAVCVAFTDGLFDLSRDKEGMERLPDEIRGQLRDELISQARVEGSIQAVLSKFMVGCSEYGFTEQQDDISILMFGAMNILPGIYESTIPLLPDDVDSASQQMAEWCRSQGWSEDTIGRLQVVFEEKVMNVHDHGFDDRDRIRERVSFRVRRRGGTAELTVWDYGSPEPSIQVIAGDSTTVFEKANQTMRDHGRGRLMVRELCNGIERNRYDDMNETIYHIPMADEGGDTGAGTDNDGKEK